MVRAIPNPAKVYVGNLPSDVHRDELKRVLGKYGNLRKVWMAHNPPGFAFVDFYNSREARICVRELNGRRVFGTTLRVELSTADEPPRRRRVVEQHRCGSTISTNSDCSRETPDRSGLRTNDDVRRNYDGESRTKRHDTTAPHLSDRETVEKLAEDLFELLEHCRRGLLSDTCSFFHRNFPDSYPMSPNHSVKCLSPRRDRLLSERERLPKRKCDSSRCVQKVKIMRKSTAQSRLESIRQDGGIPSWLDLR